MGKLYELWEIYKDGKHGEVYEVVECHIPAHQGVRVQVSHDEGGKCLLKEGVDVNDSDSPAVDLVTIYSCLGTAKYKKVPSYLKISWQEAFNRILEGKPVYAGERSRTRFERRKVTKRSELATTLLSYDLEDLLELTHYYIYMEDK